MSTPAHHSETVTVTTLLGVSHITCKGPYFPGRSVIIWEATVSDTGDSGAARIKVDLMLGEGVTPTAQQFAAKAIMRGILALEAATKMGTPTPAGI